MSLALCIAPGPLLVRRGYRRGAGALWCRAYSIEDAAEIKKESVTIVAAILTT
jgi:hypothetical protein